MATIQGIDSSYDALQVSEAMCLRRKGMKIFVQALTALPRTGLHQPPHRIDNLRNAFAGGMQTAGYLLIGPGMTGIAAVAAARRGVPVDVWKRLKFVAVDVEVQGIADTEILAALEQVERLGKTAIIYTSWNSWNTMVSPRNSTLISRAGYGLWNAKWDGNPAIDFSRLPFGGWKRSDIVGEQWSGGTIICGQSVDQNTFEEYVLLPASLPSGTRVGVATKPAVPVVPDLTLKTLVWNGKFWFAEVGVGASTHHWWIRTEEERFAYDWPVEVHRQPRGTRLDWE